MTMDWLSRIQCAGKTVLLLEGIWKVHYKFDNGEEMVEEYNASTNILVRRTWKRNKTFCKTKEWEVEIGDPEPHILNSDGSGIKESSNSPYVLKRITKNCIEWRIRNLPYPLETYSVTCDAQSRCIIIKTSNKKYYKRIQIEELERVNVVPVQSLLSFTHKYNTLIITYEKPNEVLALENQVLQELKKVKPINNAADTPACNPS